MVISKVNLTRVPIGGRLVPLLCNSPSAMCRLGYNKLWIKAYTFLQTANEVIIHKYFYIRHCYLFHSTPLSV